MLKKTSYILVGDNDTGKTSFQKWLIWHLCKDDKFNKLYCNLLHHIIHPDSPRKLLTLSTINRSIQEKMGDYLTVENYFNNHFKEADVAILSSHSHGASISEIEEMIRHLKGKYYNVSAVFFTNALNRDTSEISKLNWEEIIMIKNPNSEKWEEQINEQVYVVRTKWTKRAFI